MRPVAKRQPERRVSHSNEECADRRRGERRKVVSQAERDVLLPPATMPPKEEQKHTDLLPECRHAFPNMDSSTRRKCMKCGMKESNAISESMSKEFARLWKHVEDEKIKELNPYYKWLKERNYSKIQLFDEALNQETVYRAWRKRAEEAESGLNTRKADCHEELAGALRRLFDATVPSYHDCLDNGEPECHYCEAERALARATNHQEG